MKLEEFELSQTYMMFWDKLEKANFFLENILRTVDEPLNGRLVMWLLENAVPDGGQWDMFVNLVNKYGVVPKSVMPETYSSSLSQPMNVMLVKKLQEFAWVIRDMHEQGSSMDDLREKKETMMEEFYRMLAIHLGKPPVEFFWEWRDKDNEFHRRGKITPQEFFEEFVGIDLNDLVCVINAPTQDKPFNTRFTVNYLGNVAGGQEVSYLNVDIQTLKKAAADMIADGKAVWFGCDVGKWMEKELGILDTQIFDYSLVYGLDFKLGKAERLNYGQSQMTHAMVLTGVDLDEDGKPLKWRVENSWGNDDGDKGYLVMSDAWFEQYLYEVTVSKKYLPQEALDALKLEAVPLHPWDPMGALALAD